MALVLDTGPVLAALDRDDARHEVCSRLFSEAREPLVIVAPTLVEIDSWIRKRLEPDVWRIFIEDVNAGAYLVAELGASERQRAAELERQYQDLDPGFVDAAVIAVCESLGETKVATLDRRHFGVVRPAHCERLSMLPASDA